VSFDAVLFDMDGVLVDSEPLHFATTNAVLGRRGARLDAADYEALKGLTDLALFERLGARFGLTEPPVALAAERVGDVLVAMAEGVLLPMDGALECLLTLRADGLRLALASSATRAQVQLVVERLGIGRLLGATVSAEDAPRGKPFPDLFLTAAARLGTAPADCLVVEDAVLGVLAARAAGMSVIAVVPEGQDAGSHLQGGALAAIRSLRELTLPALEQWSAQKD
jgi:HAD superfamily hydrolase (TIGR01509 family)